MVYKIVNVFYEHELLNHFFLHLSQNLTVCGMNETMGLREFER